MTPETFIAHWQNNALTERAGAQPWFEDLCEMLGVDKPRDPDNYCFERGTGKSSGGGGWADVWKDGCFAWENKKPGGDLRGALKQLTDYALNLNNPPLLVVCDRRVIEIHTAFTGYPDQTETIRLEELVDEAVRQRLRYVFTDPEQFRPGKTTAAITLEMAGQYAELADAMRARGEDGQRVAHFLMQCLFCMFAEDEGILPDMLFTVLLERFGQKPAAARDSIERLFTAMQDGGPFGVTDIPWFNGGLFKRVDVPALTPDDITALLNAAHKDWRGIDPSIFGTLFERGLNPKARAQLGAHYTDPETIQKLIRPLVLEPLLREWESVREAIEKAMPRARTKIPKKAEDLYRGFLERLKDFRVLDPACGSGNFLYLALIALREVEKRARTEAAALGLQADVYMTTGPHNLLGLEINEYAAELARVTVWIGDLQWSRRNGYKHAENPILQPLDGIEHRDALLNVLDSRLRGNDERGRGDDDGGRRRRGEACLALGDDGIGLRAEGPRTLEEATWPKADVIVGNPPFLGGSKKRGELGEQYFDDLNATFKDVPGFADLVCYWFHKAGKQILAGEAGAAGLVATNSIRGGANRKVLDTIVNSTRIFEAWSDEPWINDGAAVRVSLVAFGEGSGCRLDGQDVAAIHADLTAGAGVDLTQARRLGENGGAAFSGAQRNGPFDIPGPLAREWLKLPNPNGRPNSEVVKPWSNGMDLTHRQRDIWIIDFAIMPEAEAALYEAPFQYVLEHVKPERMKKRREAYRTYWWRHGETRLGMRAALKDLPRYIATSLVAKHRFFVWQSRNVVSENLAVVIARDDDTSFGILSSRFHVLWSLGVCSWMGAGNDPRYTPTTCFETFPFPKGLGPHDKGHDEAIAAAAHELNDLRENWLNPPEWVEWRITPEEEKAGFPPRPVARPGHEAELKKRTLTNLYNARPTWLVSAHAALDSAVAAAYGWPDYTQDMADEEILRRLLALNLG